MIVKGGIWDMMVEKLERIMKDWLSWWDGFNGLVCVGLGNFDLVFWVVDFVLVVWWIDFYFLLCLFLGLLYFFFYCVVLLFV